MSTCTPSPGRYNNVDADAREDAGKEVVLRHTIQAVVLGILSVVALCLGYGGFEATSTFNSLGGLNHKLDSLNHARNGTGQFTYKSPMWWFGGHGGEHVGPVTLGGSGALSPYANQADSLKSELVALRGNFEVGFPYSPNQWVWFRPCLELGATGLLVYAQTMSAESKWWWAAWSIGAAPGVEVMGSLPTSSESFIGLFVKASYLIPISGPAWVGDKEPPSLSLSGFALQMGVRFGKSTTQAEAESPLY
jgi:hypothetical protein